ncbi:hypothetical protein Anapl_16044 [Anas platyrhynchos]|uniref:BHLH domain-containing protein n=1 Tax=Anas platyrhynchos TaxID=8839 RepID=R0L2D3_ANAPL|nr:hypothetical protein Anapl_16044 [Anas platyrhynchos]
MGKEGICRGHVPQNIYECIFEEDRGTVYLKCKERALFVFYCWLLPKPQVEQRRRARLNHSLERLRLLLLAATRDQFYCEYHDTIMTIMTVSQLLQPYRDDCSSVVALSWLFSQF